MILLSRCIREKWPSDLANAVKMLSSYPTSIRLANDFYEIGIPLIKEKGLYLPLIPFEAELKFFPENNSESATLSFERHWGRQGGDNLKFTNLSPGENISIDVVRRRGARRYRDWKANPLSLYGYEGILDYINATYGKFPSRVGVFKFDEQERLEQFVDYDLMGEKPPHVKKYQ